MISGSIAYHLPNDWTRHGLWQVFMNDARAGCNGQTGSALDPLLLDTPGPAVIVTATPLHHQPASTETTASPAKEAVGWCRRFR